MSDHQVKRQLGGMPTGPYNMADMAFSVHHHEPKKEQAIITEYDLMNGSITICAKQPFQDLDEAVERWIRREGPE